VRQHSLTLVALRDAKLPGIPVEFLRSIGFDDGTDEYQRPAVTFRWPGDRIRTRTSLAAKTRGETGVPIKGTLLGGHTLAGHDWALLVEGETDYAVARWCGLPVLAVPGASMADPDELRRVLAGRRLVVLVEPDRGGEQLAKSVRDLGAVELRLGADLADLWSEHRDRDVIRALVRSSPFDLSARMAPTPEPEEEVLRTSDTRRPPAYSPPSGTSCSHSRGTWYNPGWWRDVKRADLGSCSRGAEFRGSTGGETFADRMDCREWACPRCGLAWRVAALRIVDEYRLRWRLVLPTDRWQAARVRIGRRGGDYLTIPTTDPGLVVAWTNVPDRDAVELPVAYAYADLSSKHAARRGRVAGRRQRGRQAYVRTSKWLPDLDTARRTLLGIVGTVEVVATPRQVIRERRRVDGPPWVAYAPEHVTLPEAVEADEKDRAARDEIVDAPRLVGRRVAARQTVWQPVTFDDLLDRLAGVRRSGSTASARCPAHDDDEASLTVNANPGGRRVSVYCHAGCDESSVLAAVGVDRRSLFHEPPKRKEAKR